MNLHHPIYHRNIFDFCYSHSFERYGYSYKKPNDVFSNQNEFDGGCIKERGKCYFFIIALQAAILPRDNYSSNNN